MTIHRFDVNVPNPDSKACTVALRLEPADPGPFIHVVAKKGKRSCLDIIHAGIALEPCERRGKEKLKLKLEAFSSANAHVVVETNGGPGLAGLNLIDHRNGKDVGGVLLVCADPPFQEPAGNLIPSRNPCPATLARNMYAIEPDEDPGTAAPLGLVTGKVSAFELVAPVTNPTASALKEVVIYLEHSGPSGAPFHPGAWNVGGLAPGAVFFATWLFELPVTTRGPIEPCVVVSSARAEPIRLSGRLTVKRADRG